MPRQSGDVFDPRAYDHLNHRTPLHVWAKEFYSRNSDFMHLISGQRAEEADEAILKQFHVRIVRQSNFSKNRIASFTVVVPPAVQSLRLLTRRGEFETNKTATDALLQRRDEDFSAEVELLNPSAHGSDSLSPLRALLPPMRTDPPRCYRDRLFLSIDLKKPKEQIEAILTALLTVNRKRTRGNRRPEKWKLYLIVYDLKKRNLTFSRIAHILEEHYPPLEEAHDANNLQRYYTACLGLIDGGFKKYL